METIEALPSTQQENSDTIKMGWAYFLHPGVLMVLAIIVLVPWTIVAGVYAISQWSGHTDNHYAISDYFREAGFDPTVTYPVNIGSNVNGTGGEVSGSVSMFFGTGGGSVEGSLQPASSIKMLLPLEDGSSILMLVPANRIVFHRADGHAKVQFAFQDDEDFGYTNGKWYYEHGDNFMLFSTPVKADPQPGPRESKAWEQFAAQPLEKWLLESVDKIDLYVTPAQLSSILNN